MVLFPRPLEMKIEKENQQDGNTYSMYPALLQSSLYLLELFEFW